MTAPTLVTSDDTAGWTTTTSPKTTSAIAGAQSGDLLVIVAVGENQAQTLDTPTGGGFVYTLQRSVVATNYTTIYLWTAPVTSTGSVTVSIARTGGTGRWGMHASLWRGSSGVGATAVANTTGAPSLSITTTGANSAILAVNGDWNATSGARTWRTVNSITPAAGSGELVYMLDTGRYSASVADWSDAGAPGAQTVGLTAPTGQQYAIAAVEILGSGGGSTVTGTVATTWAATATAVGTPNVKGAVAATWTMTATAVGTRKTAGTIASTFGFSATAAGTGSSGATVTGTIATTWALTATALGKPTVKASIATTWALTAEADATGAPDIDPAFPWAIRCAPGYDILDDPNSMVWIDISARVRGAITLRVGKDEQGGFNRPCELRFTAETDDGLLMPTLVTSDWWPYVDRGLPIQFWRCDSTGTPVLRCTVAADAINPVWPNGLDDNCNVEIVASGFYRWLDQGQEVSVSASTQTIVAAGALSAWPLNEADGARTGWNAVPHGRPMVPTTSGVRFGRIPGPDGITLYPSVAVSGRLYGTVATTTVTDRWSVELIALAESSATDTLTIATWRTTSTSVSSWRIQWAGAGTDTTTLQWISPSGTATTVITASGDPLGDWHRVAVYCVEAGGNILSSLYIDGVLAGSGSVTSATTGRITTIYAGDWDGPGRGLVSVGDVSVWAGQIDALTSYTSQDGFAGEMAHERWLRLLTEANIPARTSASLSVRMGPQTTGSLVDALGDAEDTDGAIVYDEPDRGLVFVATSEMYNLPAALTLSARDGLHLQLPFDATYDDSRAATDVTITREDGGSRTKVVDSRRRYKDSGTLSLYTDELAAAVASWRAYHGAQEVLRYESVTWDAAKVLDGAGVPVLLDDTLALRPGQRIVLTDLPRPHPAEDVSLLLQGWTETHDLEQFAFAAKVGPARLFEVATIGSDDPGDWDDTTWRIDSDTSTVGGGGVTTTGASIVVASDYGWSTTDVPYHWNIEGEKITVTFITAYSGGTQTATVTRSVNGIVKAHSAGVAITLWRPPVIGL